MSSNILNELLLERLYEEAYEELVADGMSKGEAEIAAADVAIERSNQAEWGVQHSSNVDMD
tara:strand:+ start:225 stop:407 length:183 start_codon:yes stop_codon:yes gene_type:complete